MIGVLDHDSALVRLHWAEDNQGLWDKLCYETFPGARSIAQTVDQQFSALPLYMDAPSLSNADNFLQLMWPS